MQVQGRAVSVKHTPPIPFSSVHIGLRTSSVTLSPPVGSFGPDGPMPEPMRLVSTGRNRSPSSPVGRRLWNTIRTGLSLVAAIVGPSHWGGVTQGRDAVGLHDRDLSPVHERVGDRPVLANVDVGCCFQLDVAADHRVRQAAGERGLVLDEADDVLVSIYPVDDFNSGTPSGMYLPLAGQAGGTQRPGRASTNFSMPGVR